ncbi:hypothetical protein CcaverHIS002_0407790 [Cutaneotrichosporon cavernicola]|uniref:Uncharacterized protein n=1 Tax=Cutaneotrichosporon cavernicola TaxID=279322 RepID=A0AA48L4U5_9TREE|nr:uncharacterized protein CcaverHIS019_0407770 [Cutaneotrichosporon cavernicola]BEI84175.1 hypothetical protein CcaverHIS002_0407790 [Cutaneotrichosporon cavernicola]BEI91957.1 hypothetical protein CcaverHIS019_0407770 [Cutaneotrichosporon cavernicola]BEI99728.1 hypothetical protein CcaverHIS631_0407710 [Cutaneotrichosporon cavernicola]BEJ07504.1 hypothetical protein CcaverHIS641_0407730 [Cutaneotrichosporon cavernicola]
MLTSSTSSIPIPSGDIESEHSDSSPNIPFYPTPNCTAATPSTRFNVPITNVIHIHQPDTPASLAASLGALTATVASLAATISGALANIESNATAVANMAATVNELKTVIETMQQTDADVAESNATTAETVFQIKTALNTVQQGQADAMQSNATNTAILVELNAAVDAMQQVHADSNATTGATLDELKAVIGSMRQKQVDQDIMLVAKDTAARGQEDKIADLETQLERAQSERGKALAMLNEKKAKDQSAVAEFDKAIEHAQFEREQAFRKALDKCRASANLDEPHETWVLDQAMNLCNDAIEDVRKDGYGVMAMYNWEEG